MRAAGAGRAARVRIRMRLRALFRPGREAGGRSRTGRPEVWLLFLQFQTVLRLVRAARIRGVSPPPVDVFGFERYPETVRRLKACVEGAATDARG